MVNASQVCKELVIPSTAAWSCRYVDTLDDRDVSTPHFFLSHHWWVCLSREDTQQSISAGFHLLDVNISMFGCTLQLQNHAHLSHSQPASQS